MDSHSASLITTLLLLFVSALIGGLLARRFRQPMVVGYIAAGLVFGNVFPRLTDPSLVRLVADSGVTLLLFTLGIEFSFSRLRRVLGTVFWPAIAQIVVVMFVCLLVLVSSGVAFVSALFIAAAISLSSTAVVVKVLSERGELETIPGEVLTGWLVVQDLAVVPLMIILSALPTTGVTADATIGGTVGNIALAVGKAAVYLLVVVVIGRRVIPALLDWVADLGSRELFLLVVVGVILLAGLATYAVGLSAALGAFVAGILLADTSQNHAIFSEIRPLRDLFATVFFVSLGMVIPLAMLVPQLPQLLGLTLLVIAIKWTLCVGLARFVGYHRKTAVIVGLGLVPMSEFGFLLAQEGLSHGALGNQSYVLLVALTFTTILVGAPLLTAGNWLYYEAHARLRRFVPKFFPEKAEAMADTPEITLRGHIVICGYGRVGRYIGRALQMADIPFLVVDYNNATVAKIRASGITVVYGDPADKEVLDVAEVDYARAIIIAIPDRHTQELVISHAQTLNKKIKIICRTHHEEDQRRLKSLGVQTIVQPEFEAALSVVSRLLADFGVSAEDISGKVSRLKIEHGLG